MVKKRVRKFTLQPFANKSMGEMAIDPSRGRPEGEVSEKIQKR